MKTYLATPELSAHFKCATAYIAIVFQLATAYVAMWYLAKHHLHACMLLYTVYVVLASCLTFTLVTTNMHMHLAITIKSHPTAKQ